MFAQFGKTPALLPLSCRLEAGSWCPTLSVKRFLASEEASRLRGPTPLPWTLSSPPSVSFFPSRLTEPPALSVFSRLIAKASPFVGDHKAATPFIFWMGVEGKGEAATKEQPYPSLGVKSYSHIFEPSGFSSVCPRPSLKNFESISAEQQLPWVAPPGLPGTPVTSESK